MIRSYTTQDDTALLHVVGDAHACADELGAELARAIGVASVEVEVDESFVFVPPLWEVLRHVRAPLADDYAAYEAAARRVAARRPCRAVRAFFEEIYVLDWDRIAPPEMTLLGAAYTALPGWIGFDPPAGQGMPRWFGHDEERGPYLTASVEPPGLQVSGLLERDLFAAWHRAFLAATTGLPFRTLE